MSRLGIYASQISGHLAVLPPVSGYSLWLDAADASVFTFSSGSQVSQWNDKSANNYIFQQSTSSNQPIRNGSLNSKSTVTFDGSNDYMESTNAAGLNPTSWSLFIVAQGIGSGVQTIVAKRGGNLASDDAWGGGYYSGKQYSRGRNLSGGTNATITAGGSGLYIIQSNGSNGLTGSYISTSSVMTNNSSIEYRFAGANLASGTAGSQAVTGAGQVTLGTLKDGAPYSEFLNGNIAEILLYSSALNSTNRSAVESYLTTKWGV